MGNLEKATMLQTLTANSMYGTAYQFSRKFFTGWVIVSLLWAFFSFFSVTIFPIIEGRHLLLSWTKALFGKSGKAQQGDEFDHHRHAQRYDESPKTFEEKQNATGQTTPVEVNEKDSA
jgi:urea-proton symporter